MQAQPEQVLGIMAVLAIAASLSIWTMVALRLRRARPIVPYQPRRLVPWRGIDLLIVLAGYLAVAVMAATAANLHLGPELTRPPAIQDLDQANSAHVVARLLTEGNLWVLLVCILSAAVVAPVTEEFFFRVLLQGWLESGQRRLRPRMPALSRCVPGAVGPIVIASFLFAQGHFRVAGPMMHPRFVIFVLAGDGVARLAAMGLAIGLLRLRVGATGFDLGWDSTKLLADVKLGLLAFAGLAAPVYAAQVILAKFVLPSYLAPDPFVLFFFALALGALYWRTHRIVAPLVLHMALNVTSLTMAWFLPLE